MGCCCSLQKTIDAISVLDFLNYQLPPLLHYPWRYRLHTLLDRHRHHRHHQLHRITNQLQLRTGSLCETKSIPYHSEVVCGCLNRLLLLLPFTASSMGGEAREVSLAELRNVTGKCWHDYHCRFCSHCWRRPFEREVKYSWSWLSSCSCDPSDWSMPSWAYVSQFSAQVHSGSKTQYRVIYWPCSALEYC